MIALIVSAAFLWTLKSRCYYPEMNPLAPLSPRQIRLSVRGSLRSRRSGFALLITIILMAFLVLLLVGFASFTRVETQLAINNQQMAQARQNALFGLNIALGRLQAAAGPDQRTTAAADLFNKDVESDLPASPTLTNPVPLNKRYWTGVFKQSATLPSDPSITPDPVFVEWLVSGIDNNVEERLNPTAHTKAFVMPAYTFPSINDKFVTLVGPKTVSRTTDHIVVGLEDINSTQQPGFAPGSPPAKIGRYGYWVGDEGVKLRINLDPQIPAGGAQSDRNREGLYRWASAMAPAVDQMNTNPADLTKVLGTAYSGNLPSTLKPDGTLKLNLKPDGTPRLNIIPNVLDLRQLPIAATDATTNGPESTSLSDFSKLRFHEISAHSAGVLADSREGGLRVDLTRVLGAPSMASDPDYGDNTVLYPAAITSIYSGTASLPLFLTPPTWGLLRSWAQHSVAPGATSLASRAAQSNVAAHGPVILTAQMNWSLITSVTGAQPVMAPTVILWNPYPVDMPAADYEFGIGVSGLTHSLTRSPALDVVDSADEDLAGTFRFLISSQSWVNKTGTAPSGAPTPYRFKLSSGGISAGQAKLYCLKNDITTPYNPASISTYEMVASGDIANHIYAGPTSAAIPSGAKYRALNGGSTSPGFDPAIQVYLADFGGSAVNEMSTGIYTCLPLTASNRRPTSPPTTPPPTTLTANPQFLSGNQSGAGSQGTIINLISGAFRWLVNFNPRGQLMSPRDAGFSFTAIPLSLNDATPYRANEGDLTSGSAVHADPLTGVLDNFGTALNASGPEAGNNRFIVWDVPRQDPATLLPLLFSPADLRHASLDRSSRAPAYSIGNGVADARISRAKANDSIPSGFKYASTEFINLLSTPKSFDAATPIVDSSYVLNRAFWDKFFFSTLPLTVPSTYADNRPANARLSYLATNAQTDLQDHNKASGKLMLEGAFNINSTSVDAWQALLSSRQNLPYDPVTRTWDQTPLGGAVFSRFLSPLGSSVDSVSNSSSGLWDGYRQLTNAGETRRLAEQIVREIKARALDRNGPVLSLADFVNRKLHATSVFGLSGSLQAALDAIDSSANPFAQQKPYTTTTPAAYIQKQPTGNKVPAMIYENRRGRLNSDSILGPSNSLHAGGPGMITQHDILALIGGHIASRSDTFRIRVYGESINPATTTIAARTWCEAIVQRLPDYCDSTANTPDQIPAAGSTNERFGRKFKIVDFRWLNKDDI